MQASLMDFDDLLGPPAADTAQRKEPVTGAHHLQQMGGSPSAAADVSDLWSYTASVAQHVASHPAASNDPGQDFTPAEQQPQERQMMATMQEHALQKPPLQEQQQWQQHHQHPNPEADVQQSHVPTGSFRPQSDQHACQQHGNPHCTSCSSSNPSLLPVCERVACLGQLLQQHGAAQGEANASIRLLLATISAKQVKTRQLLAGISAAHAASTQQQQQQPEQQLQQAQQQLQQQLTDSRSELAVVRSELEAAQAELQQLKAAEAEQAEVRFLHDAEMQQLRASEQQAHAEVQGLQDKLLEAEEALSRLSASLPGNRGRCGTATWQLLSLT
ncbi:hypothetical protein COO60DRAFT_555718 [Scenedesmus sp. NREL 46B-D3]|nr:hypothetical protein COO60DRAFT_555718 [Scenedesmus sp. NREL 46B-D3]